MGHFKNFKTVVYIPAQVAASFDEEKLEKDYAFLEKYMGLDKVYLETHRGDCDVDREQILRIRDFLENKGVIVSGGITTTVNDFEGAEGGKRRIFDTFCYTDPAMREKLVGISEYAAGLFDEVILDDFYFTNCSCERCIKAKGDRDWVSFRRELMREVSSELIVKSARAVNPKVRMIIKYPNWRESYHFTGYLPDAQRDIFDATYIGTETRSPRYADQHLPEYLSYALVRYMENTWKDRNGGGWYDTYQCWSVDRYLEQAYLTAFAGAKELMHFQWSDLIDNKYIAALSLQLARIDAMLDDIGNPIGIPVYIPYSSCGENHLEMRLGMLGFNLEPTPEFVTGKGKLLLTESALFDEDVIDKLAEYVRNGGDAVITSGFLKKAGDRLRALGLTEAYVSDRKLSVTRYHITGDYAGYLDGRKPVIFPELLHGNNMSWSLLNGGDGDYHASLFLRSSYGKGRLYIMAVPDNSADLNRIPKEAIDVIKRVLSEDVYASGNDFSVFAYDDGSMILYRYAKEPLRPSHVRIFTKKNVRAVRDMESGREYAVFPVKISEDFEEHEWYVADVILEPGEFYRFEYDKG